MKLYNTEKELFMSDYKPLSALRGVSLPELYELLDNIEKAIENAWLNGNDLLAIAFDQQAEKVNLYIRMYEMRDKK